MLVVRAAMPTPDRTAFVIVDLPVDTAIVAQLDDHTGARMGRFTPPDRRQCGVDPPPSANSATPPPLFTRTVAFMDCTNWATGCRRTSADRTPPLVDQNRPTPPKCVMSRVWHDSLS